MVFPKRGREFLVALGIAGGATGCAGEEVKAKDVKDAESDFVKVDILKGKEKVDKEDDVFFVSDEKSGEFKDVFEQDPIDNVESDFATYDLKKEKVEEKTFENYLLHEAMGLKSEKSLPGFDMDSEAKRIIPKLAIQYSDKMFGDQAVHFMKKHFRHLIENKEYRHRVKENVKKYCERYDVPVSVAMGVIGVESGGDNNMVSNKQAHGIFQVKQVAADHLRKLKFNGEDWKDINIDELEDNIRVGVAYLKYMHKRFGQYGLALAAYNTGPGNFEASVVSRLNRYNYDRYSVEKRENKLAIPPQRINKEMIKKYPGGWPAFLRDNGINMISACSKDGLGMCERGYGKYPFNALFLSETVKNILESGVDEPEITLITEQFK